MTAKLTRLIEALNTHLQDKLANIHLAYRQINITVNPENLLEAGYILRDTDVLEFDQLMDLCGVDYQTYGCSEWDVENVSSVGFSRGVSSAQASTWPGPRFSVVYHFMSTKHNWRLRCHVPIPDKGALMLDSVNDIWASASWFEREAYDLYGILFRGHPDLRRILTDYGFIGHPFRKDFPLSGHVEMRYDAKLGRVVYDPVDIEPRVTVPRVIRGVK